MLLQLSQIFPFIPLQSAHSPFPQSIPSQLPMNIHIRVFFDYSLRLLSTSPHLPPSPLTIVSVCHVSVPLILFWLLAYFVHQIPLISQIIWYLSFIDWLISLSIIVSSSIYAVIKGRNFFFLMHSITLCKSATVF